MSTHIEQRVRRWNHRNRILTNEAYAALALAAATLAALVWANIGGTYAALWSTELGLSWGESSFALTLHEWVDEGVMTLFFFMVGLDVRRELTIGGLRSKERALLPVLAALGGLVAPAVLFLLLGRGQTWSHAWGAVISTDTAFAVGMLALFGPRYAPRLKIFLLALAVIDDIAALVVIALVYSEQVHVAPLAVAAGCLAVIVVLQRMGVWRAWPYVGMGVATWFAVYASGVHATLAGVLIALIMPVYQTRRQDLALSAVAFRLFRQAPAPSVAASLRDAVTHAIPLNQRLSTALIPFVNYGVVPLFALTNAGVPVTADGLAAAFTSRLTWAIVISLVLGKTVGIWAVSMLVARLSPSSRLPGVDGPRVAGLAGLCGMGFTISLLVASMALPEGPQQDHARIGIITASMLALLVSVALFGLGNRFRPLSPPAGELLPRAVDPASDHVRGPADAPVTVVVYGSMSPFFRTSTASALRDLCRRSPEQVRLVFRHRRTGDESDAAAYALEAAAGQGTFWEFYDALTTRIGPLDRDSILEIAGELGLDAEAFISRIADSTDEAHILDDALDVEGIELAPALAVVYVGGRRLDGPVNVVTLLAAVRERSREAAEARA